jgi:hypothetical protein
MTAPYMILDTFFLFLHPGGPDFDNSNKKLFVIIERIKSV